MMASRNFVTLAKLLSDTFTVIVPDRRGRGASGTYGARYSIERDGEDTEALLEKTGATGVFGLSSGAIIAFHAALTSKRVRQVALYEPPLVLPGSTHLAWVPRYDREVAEGRLAHAMASVIIGTGDWPWIRFVPRVFWVPLLRLAINAEERRTPAGESSVAALIKTMHYDAQIVREMTGALERARDLRKKTLLMGGANSAPFLKTALDALEKALPDATRVELPRTGHLAADNNGKPELVAAELRRFFADRRAIA
jgi:pimeloyl-ACP methyl ester carboxylesterase